MGEEGGRSLRGRVEVLEHGDSENPITPVSTPAKEPRTGRSRTLSMDPSFPVPCSAAFVARPTH
jgi:hypothetical protein